VPRLLAPALPGWLARHLPFERYRIEIDGVKLHVMEGGDPRGRPVLLAHGNPTWGFLWRRVAAALAGEKLRLVMPDLAGLGLSDKPRDASFHTIARHGALFAGLLDRLALDKLVFVGQDWGGPVGLHALHQRPGRLAGLVLANTVVGPPRPGFKPTGFHRFARLPIVPDVVFRGLGFPQNGGLRWAQGDKSSIRGEVARAYRWPLRHLADRVAPLAMARMVPDTLEHPSVAALQECQSVVEGFKGPVALVWGEKDPVLGRVLGHLSRLVPRASVTKTDAGHFLQEEVPDAIAAAIRQVAAAAA
jgi:cis-3-alkyl-4-acyloxetan-2-one decarboxylase